MSDPFGFTKSNKVELEQSEIINFQKQQLIELKTMMHSQNESMQALQKENRLFQSQIINLKGNNSCLSQTFDEIQSNYVGRLQILEEKTAILSVERAEREFQLDVDNIDIQQNLRHDQIQQKKLMQERELQMLDLKFTIKNLQEQLDLQQQDNSRIIQDSLSNSMEIIHPTGLSTQQSTVQSLQPESFNMTNDEFQEFKQSNKSYISLIDSFQSAVSKGVSLREQNEKNIRLMISNLPTSAYSILYEQEMDRLQCTKAKSAEVQIWETEVMNLFVKKQKNEGRIREKISMYIRNFFPEQFRGKLWKFLVGNGHHVSKSLYSKICNSIPNNPMVTEELLHLINSDLKRTFEFINSYDNHNKLKDDLREILIIFQLYRPDIGYVQGMTYLAFMFLIRMDKIQAFKCFVNLILKSQLLKCFYGFKQNEIEAHFSTFQYFLNDKLPDVAKHMAYYEIPQQSFLVEWFYTLYARAFNLVVSSQVWDQFLFEGDIYIYRVCLGILYQIQEQLLNCDYEDSLILIRNCSVKLNDQQLFKAISKCKITKSSFQMRYEKEIQNILESNTKI